MRQLRLWAPVLAWMAAIFYASAQTETGALGRVPDWLTHGASYLVLGAFLARALAGGFDRRLSPAAAFLTVGIGTAYGATDEWHQSFTPGRDPSLGDVAKDFAGCALAASVHAARRLPRRSEA
jgi:VanZ family protein